MAVRAGFEPARRIRSRHIRFQGGALRPLEAPHRGDVVTLRGQHSGSRQRSCRPTMADEEGFEPPDPFRACCFRNSRNRPLCHSSMSVGADGGTRTLKALQPLRPERSAVTNFATSACIRCAPAAQLPRTRGKKSLAEETGFEPACPSLSPPFSRRVP